MTNIPGEVYESLEGILEIVVSEPAYIKEWFDYLKKREIRPDTIRGRLNNISILLQQFSTSPFRAQIPSSLLVVKSLVKLCVFDMKTKTTSSDDMFNGGLLPRNGKADLIDMWELLCPLLDQILAMAVQHELSLALFSLANKIIFFGFYSENANGRMNAIVNMTHKDFQQLCRQRYFASNKTKSFNYHGKQIVCLGNQSDLVVQIEDYIKYLRPQAVLRAARSSCSSSACADQNSEFVFLQ